jgi:hypothetical protein
LTCSKYNANDKNLPARISDRERKTILFPEIIGNMTGSDPASSPITVFQIMAND